MKVGKTCFDESCFALTFRLELGVKKTCGFIQPCNGSGSVGEVMEEMFLFSKLVPLELSLITQFTRLLLLGNLYNHSVQPFTTTHLLMATTSRLKQFLTRQRVHRTQNDMPSLVLKTKGDLRGTSRFTQELHKKAFKVRKASIYFQYCSPAD